MVLNPKLSQSVVSWCLESALGLIFKAAESIGDKLDQKKARGYFEDYTLNSDVTGIQISQMLYDLKKRKYIEIGEGDSVKLTDKAKIKIIDRIGKTLEIDGKYRLISFDIPESKRANRDAFRRAIKKLGFKQVQKSLWVTNRNVGEYVDIAAKEYKVSDYIAYFVVDKSNIDKYLQKVAERSID